MGKSNLSIAVSLTDIVETCTSLDELMLQEVLSKKA